MFSLTHSLIIINFMLHMILANQNMYHHHHHHHHIWNKTKKCQNNKVTNKITTTTEFWCKTIKNILNKEWEREKQEKTHVTSQPSRWWWWWILIDELGHQNNQKPKRRKRVEKLSFHLIFLFRLLYIFNKCLCRCRRSFFGDYFHNRKRWWW